MTMLQLRPRVVELPPIYGDHADPAAVLATPILARFVDTNAFKACDLVELALFGGRYIHENGQWLEAVMPLITQIETKIRGLPTVVPKQEFLDATTYASNLRRIIKLELELEPLAAVTDARFVDMCREEMAGHHEYSCI